MRRKVKEAGGVRAFARESGLSPAMVSRVMRGENRAGRRTLEALGLTERRIYSIIEEDEGKP